jgi:hypothetical protein
MHEYKLDEALIRTWMGDPLNRSRKDTPSFIAYSYNGRVVNPVNSSQVRYVPTRYEVGINRPNLLIPTYLVRYLGR